jgi:AraC-like DNA-binding protein
MAVMIESVQAHAAHREWATRAELTTRIAQVVRTDGSAEPIPGLHLHRVSRTNEPTHSVYMPSFCVIGQGRKEITLGARTHHYDAEHYLLVTVELPFTGRIVDASRDRPYLCLNLDLDPALVGSVMVEAGLPAPRGHTDAKGLVVSALDIDLLDAALRLMRLLDTPAQASVLVPLVKREIVFRLLLGEQGHRLRHFPLLCGHSHPIARAIERVRQDFDKPLRIERIAREIGMSASGFHHHFKAITDMSPLQFQKQLRLQEARRLMLGEDLDVARAGMRVGYNDASQFSREYKKHFGTAPARDVELLRVSLGEAPQHVRMG